MLNICFRIIGILMISFFNSFLHCDALYRHMNIPMGIRSLHAALLTKKW